MARLISCRYCGRVHAADHDCGRKPQRRKRTTDASSFRNTKRWQRKREDIKRRDGYVCQACIRGYGIDKPAINCSELHVHHIEPLEEVPEKGLDDDELITLCGRHHEQAEAGKIPKKILKEWVRENKKSIFIPPG